MSKWEEVKLGDIAKTQSGGTPSRSKKQYWNGDIPWLKSGELEDSFNVINNTEFITELGLKESSAKLFSKGTLLLAMYGATAGKLGILGIDACTNQAVCSIQNNKNLFDEKFVYFFLLLKREQIIKDSFGGAQPNISKTYIDNIKIPLPPLPVQKQIVAKLDALFERIDKSITLLEENIKHTQDLMASVLDEEFNKLYENEPHEIVDNIVDLQRGHNPPKKDFIYKPKKGYIRFLQIRDGSSDKNAVYVPITKKLHLVNEDELLLVAYRHVGKVFRKMSGAFNVALCKLTKKDYSKLDIDYLYYLVQSKYIKGELLSRSERALIPSMSVDHLKSLRVPFPSIEKQILIKNKLEQMEILNKKLLNQLNSKLGHLKSLKSSLLDMAFKGELVE